ncbi:MAG: MFS transporter [bacterium]|jgi:DHA1 family multidrug resistance protein-like MFS transporter|nr:MFS transporter [bacterium]MDD4152473.1 MFS transporter [bacterium]MDD4557638.1 MFS transporter [bacterium]
MLKRLHSTYISIFERYPVLLPLAVLSVIAEMGYSLMLIFGLPLYLTGSFKTGYTFVGFAIAAFTGTEMIFKPILGHLSDRIGRKPLMVAGMAASTLTPLLIAVSPFTYLILFLRAVDGAGAAALWPAISAIAADVVDIRERTTALSVFNMAYMIGVGLGPVAGSLMVALFTEARFLFYMVSLLFFLSLLIAWSVKWHKQPSVIIKDRVTRAEAGNRATEVKAVPVKEAKSNKPRLQGIFARQQELFQGSLPALYLMGTIQMLGISALSPILIKYITEVMGISQARIPILFLLPAASIALFSIPLGRMADHIGKRTAVIIGGTMASIAVWLIPFAKDLVFFMPLGVITGLGFVTAVPAWLAHITEAAPKGRTGAVIGMLGTAQGIGSVIGPIAGGYAKDILGFNMPFYVSAIFLTLTTLMAVLFMKNSSLDNF